MKSKNMILEGNFKGYKLYYHKNYGLFFKKNVFDPEYTQIGKRNILNYEVITKDSYVDGTSAVIKGGLASSLLGAPGLLAGLSAKTNDIYWVAIEWGNHTKSLLEMDSNLYHQLILSLF